MKHVFIINPAAGKYDQTGEFSEKIHSVCGAKGLDYGIFVSRARGDCTAIARDAAAKGGELRVYACGGDGTLNEVVNGIAGFENAAATHFPGGSGNDFVKIFSEPAAFRDLDRLLNAEQARFDLIRCGGMYSLNVCSMGFDARIGTAIGKYKRLPLVTGNGAYILSTGINLIKGVHQHFVVDLDGQRFDARQSLICIANGRWYGGSFNPVPVAEPDDGLLDVLLVKAVSRLTVANVIGKYKAGRYEDIPELVKHFRCRRIEVLCDRPSEINLDGELLMAKQAVFEVVPQAVRFFYPKGLTYHARQTVAK